jgi:hypothetical protein
MSALSASFLPCLVPLACYCVRPSKWICWDNNSAFPAQLSTGHPTDCSTAFFVFQSCPSTSPASFGLRCVEIKPLNAWEGPREWRDRVLRTRGTTLDHSHLFVFDPNTIHLLPVIRHNYLFRLPTLSSYVARWLLSLLGVHGDKRRVCWSERNED